MTPYVIAAWLAVQAAVFEVETVIDVGRAPHQIHFTDDGTTALIAAAGSDHIAVVDARTERLRGEIPAPGTPLGVVALDSGELIVSRFASDTLGLLSPDGDVVRELHVGGGPSLVVGPSPKNQYLVSIEKENVLRVVDGDDLNVARSYHVGSRPFPPSATSDGRLAFVPNYDDGTVTVIDLWNERVRDVVPVGAQPSGGAFLPFELEYAVAVRGENRIAFLDSASFHVTGTLEDGIGDEPFSVVVSPDGRFAFVNNVASDDISVVELPHKRVIERVEVGAKPIAMAVSPASDTLWVASEGSHTVTIVRIPPRADAAETTEANTEVAVLGMTHGRHRDSSTWSLAHVAETIRRLEPDVVCTEIPPNRWDAARKSFADTGAIAESRVVRFPEYTDVLLPLSKVMDFEIVPCAGWTQEMSDLRRTRIHEFDTDPAHSAAKREYDARMATARNARPDASTMDDPRFIHSDRYDGVMRNEYTIYDQTLNDWIGPGGWTQINESHYALVENAIRGHAGKRVLVTFGGAHKYWIRDRLRERDDITLLDVNDFLPGESTDMEPLEADDDDSRCREEVFELHQFFEDWFGGVIPVDGGLRRFESVLADDFEIVSPEGGKSSRTEIVKTLAGAHGVFRDQGVRIWIENFRSRPIGDGARIATYEEWQRIGGKTKARLSTVVLTRSEGTPNGVSWRHVHETWLP